jgi:hypothetical protein
MTPAVWVGDDCCLYFAYTWVLRALTLTHVNFKWQFQIQTRQSRAHARAAGQRIASRSIGSMGSHRCSTQFHRALAMFHGRPAYPRSPMCAIIAPVGTKSARAGTPVVACVSLGGARSAPGR